MLVILVSICVACSIISDLIDIDFVIIILTIIFEVN